MRQLLPILFTLLIAGISSAETTEKWSYEEAGTSSDCTGDIAPGTTCFWSPATADISPLLRAEECENVDICWNSHTGGTTYLSTAQFWWCASTSYSVNTCEIVKNVTLDGDPSTATGTDCIYGVGGSYFFMDFLSKNGADTPRAVFTCNR